VVSVVDEIVAFAAIVVIFEAPVAFTVGGLLKKIIVLIFMQIFSVIRRKIIKLSFDYS